MSLRPGCPQRSGVYDACCPISTTLPSFKSNIKIHTHDMSTGKQAGGAAHHTGGKKMMIPGHARKLPPAPHRGRMQGCTTHAVWCESWYRMYARWDGVVGVRGRQEGDATMPPGGMSERSQSDALIRKFWGSRSLAQSYTKQEPLSQTAEASI